MTSYDAPPDCKLEKLEEYKKTMQTLSEPTIIFNKENNRRTYKYSDNDVKYGQKTFCINLLDYSFLAASVTSITSYTSNGKRLDKVTCTGYVDENLIVLENVKMKKTIGRGNCTKAVAYLIKTLMLEAKKGSRNLFPHKGTVYVSSKNACAAANCYIKAFMLNGFDYDKEELKKFQDNVKINGDVDYELNFKNKKQEQEQKRIDYQDNARPTKRQRRWSPRLPMVLGDVPSNKVLSFNLKF